MENINLDAVMQLTKPIPESNEFTDWQNEPTVADLREDYTNCRSDHDSHVNKIDKFLSDLKAEPINLPKGVIGSTVQSKLIRKQAEWRYCALSEPFLDTANIFKVNPVSFEDSYSARQNELVLNYQFNTQFNKTKLIDEYVRDAVNKGTAILRVGWLETQEYLDIPVPQYQIAPIDPSQSEAINKFNRIAKMVEDSIDASAVPDQWKQAVQQAQAETQQREQEVFAQVQYQISLLQQQGMPQEQLEQAQQELLQKAQQQLQSMPPIAYEPIQVGTAYSQEVKVINKPTVNLCNYRDVYIDPSCEGDLDKAEYIIYKFTSCKADLLKDGRYANVDKIPDTTNREFDESYNGENLKDPARRKITVYEYWGNWDINGDGNKVPIVATWVGETMLRLEENPYPDHKPPFVVVPYLPISGDVYGEPDGALLVDNQTIIGAMTRGIIDLLAKSANSQTAMPMQFLDPLNKKAFREGRDYEYNPTMQAQQAIFQHTFPEIPQTVPMFIQSLQYEAEALTGVKGFSQGIDGNAYGDTATGVRGVLDASSKREMGILRRLADGLKQVARKIIAMNALWLNEKEVIRITNQDFVEIHRDDLAGNFDLQLDITSAEQNNAKSESLAFMLQTLGNTVDQRMTQLILSEICDLKKMPELAERVRRFEPKPDPMQEKLQQMQIELLQAQIDKLKADAGKSSADAELSNARTQSEVIGAQLDMQLRPQELLSKIQSEMSKAQYNNAMAKKLDLDYMDELNGTSHRRELEKQSAQARAQAEKSIQEKYMDFLIEKQKSKNKQGSK